MTSDATRKRTLAGSPSRASRVRPGHRWRLALLALSSAAGFAAAQELVVLSWTGYMDPAVIDTFEAQHGTRLRFDYAESPDDQVRMLANNKGGGFDVAQIGLPYLPTYAEAGWLARLDLEAVPNRQHIGERWMNALQDHARYCVPFLWGGIGVTYRSDLVESPPGSWKEFLTPRPGWQGKVTMTRGARELMAMALLASDHSINSTDREQINAAGDLLVAHKPMVANNYRFTALDESARLLNGDAVAAFSWSGGPRLLMNKLDSLRFIYPGDRTALWMDALCVLDRSERKALAHAFINYVNEPFTAAKIAVSITNATTNASALDHVPDEYRNDTVIWPSEHIIQDAEFIDPLPPRTLRYYNQIRSRLLR